MSLRQKQINEILGYHDNINRDVFEREKKHVYYSGLQEARPRERDLVVEAELKQRVTAIQYDIQNITQSIHYIPSASLVSAIGEAYGEEEGEPGRYKQYVEQSNLSRQKSGKDNFDRMFSFLTKLIRDWNNLVDYYVIKTQQNQYSDAQESSLKDSINSLVEPLKDLLQKVVLLKPVTHDYYKIYNPISVLLRIVESGDLSKLSSTIINEAYDVNYENYSVDTRNLIKQKMADYTIRIKDVEMMVPSSKTEEKAIERLKDWYVSERNKLDKFLSKGKPTIYTSEVEGKEGFIDDIPLDKLFKKFVLDRKPGGFKDTQLQQILSKIKPENKEVIGESKSEEPETSTLPRSASEPATRVPPYGRSEYSESRDAPPPPVRRIPPPPPNEFLTDMITHIEKSSGFTDHEKYLMRNSAIQMNQLGKISKSELADIIKKIESAPVKEPESAVVKKPERKKGGAAPLGNFPDEATLAPYISKHLKPSRFKNIMIEDDTSSESGSDTDSEASSSEDEAKGGRKKRGGAKPVIINSPDKDLWFL
jgi:hypothetical protein